MARIATPRTQTPKDDFIDPRRDFDAVVREFGPKVYRLGLSQCGHPDGAEDLVQETMLRAWKQRNAFRGDSKVGTWIYTIAVRTCQRLRRKRVGEPREFAEFDAESMFAASSVADPRAVRDESGRTALERAAAEAVERALPSVPDPFRMPLVLKEIAGLSIESIARILRLKPSTVKTRVHRGRLLLRGALESVSPRRDHPQPLYPLTTCIELLAAKQEALDAGEAMPGLDSILCERCQAMFATLDLGQEACRRLSAIELPHEAKRALDERLRALRHDR